MTRFEPTNRTVSLLDGALAASNRVHGWLTSNEQKLLYTLARRVPPEKAIVELGAWMGKATIMLAAGSMAGSRVPVHAVDFFVISQDAGHDYSRHLPSGTQEYLSMFLSHIRQACVAPIVIPLRSSTVDAAKIYKGPSVDLLFIDANHDYRAVCDDFLAWVRHCGPGAQITFHDYAKRADHPGVSRFVDRLLVARILVRTRVVDSILHGELTVGDVTVVQRRLGLCPVWLPQSLNIMRRIPRGVLHPRAALRAFHRFQGSRFVTSGSRRRRAESSRK